MKIGIFVLIGCALIVVALPFLPMLALKLVGWGSPQVVYSVQVQERVVALSIDDGPSSATPEILDVLAENGARATFFLIGEHVRARPDLARRLVERGHEVGHHMMQDRPSRSLPGDLFEARFDAMHRLLEELGGSSVFRPGSGWYDARMVRAAEERGYRTVLGSVYPFDTVIPVPALLSWYVLRRTAPGDILILHDGPERGLRTAEVLRTVLPELRRRGYEVVTVSELLAWAEGERLADPQSGKYPS